MGGHRGTAVPLPAQAFPAGVPARRAWTVVLPRWLRLLPPPSYAATTLGPLIFLRDRDVDPGLLAHEAVHVWQWRRDGAVRFPLRYLGDYLAGRLRGLGHDAAYRAIGYEVEARARSGSAAS